MTVCGGNSVDEGLCDYAGSSFVFHDVRMLMVGNRTINFRPGLEVEDSKMLLRRPRTCIFSTIRLTLGRHDRRLIQRTNYTTCFFWGVEGACIPLKRFQSWMVDILQLIAKILSIYIYIYMYTE